MNPKPILDNLFNYYWNHLQERHNLSGLTEAEEWHTAMIHFKNYAYERNVSGANKRYKEISEQVLKSVNGLKKWDNHIEKELWKKYRDTCRHKGIKCNEVVDPMRPSKGQKVSLLKFVYHLEDANTVAAWAAEMINANKIEYAHSKLKRVWGIRDKIASFYLRDIYYLSHNLSPRLKHTELKNSYLLQPIDIWMERAAKALSAKHKSAAEALNDFERANELPIGYSNIAFWVLGSTYVDISDFDLLVKSMTNKSPIDKSRIELIAKEFRCYGAFADLLLRNS